MLIQRNIIQWRKRFSLSCGYQQISTLTWPIQTLKFNLGANNLIYGAKTDFFSGMGHQHTETTLKCESVKPFSKLYSVCKCK